MDSNQDVNIGMQLRAYSLKHLVFLKDNKNKIFTYRSDKAYRVLRSLS